ncbi:MAG: redoxin domain-containing protein [Acidobacteriia bacterium]|nr:redoxin domain-containing protein [Terriglobia bacterium]
MPKEKPRSVPRDLLAGFLAIVLVLASAVLTRFAGSDLRVLIAVTGSAFYFAGLARGLSAPLAPWIKAVLVSSPGLLGTAALIMNDGLHRLGIPVAVSLTAILLTLAGVRTRRLWGPARRSSVLLAGATAIALAGWVIAVVPTLVIHSSLIETDRPVAEFSVSDSEGRVVKSSDLKGRVVVLAFWATWCLPCRWELPEVQSVYDTFKQNRDVTLLAVDVDWGGETRERSRRFFSERKWTLPWAFDNGGAARSLGVDSLPTVVLLDKEGRIRTAHYGYDASEHLDRVVVKAVEELLAEREH